MTLNRKKLWVINLRATTYGIFYLPEKAPFSTLIELIGKVNRIFSLLTCVNNLFRPFEPKMEDHENIS